MSFSHSTTMTWSCLNTKEDLLKLFTGRVDQDVIEIIIESRNNDCKLKMYNSFNFLILPR